MEFSIIVSMVKTTGQEEIFFFFFEYIGMKDNKGKHIIPFIQ